ncbi:hypothetical protein DFH28DRAFT_906379 [Melampsora americana]|nr:hypothetical protein DFH28DRAFT_906379 [Melampsora americana]
MLPVHHFAFRNLNPIQPLPVPTRHTKQSGLICSSENCINRPPHSTLYYRPKKQPNGKLIGVKVSTIISINYIYSFQMVLYFLADHKAKIHAHNSQLSSPAMHVDPQLSGTPSSSSTPSARQSNRRTKTQLHAQCNGVKGKFAAGHTLRKNQTCVVGACRECCDQLKDPSQRCQPHGAMSNLKAKRNNNQSQSSNPNDAITISDSEPSSIRNLSAITQAGRTFSRRLLEPELGKFKSISIKRQADKRTQRAYKETVKKQVTLIVWTGCKTDRGHWGGVVYAPQWPILSFSQSGDLMRLVHKHLGDQWNGSLQVWTEEHQAWIYVPIEMLHQYPTDTRKLLVLFPEVDPNTCVGLDHQLASVSSKHQSSMNISKYLTPSPRKNISPTLIPILAADHCNLVHDESESSSSSSAGSDRTNPNDKPTDQDDLDGNGTSSDPSRWPGSTSMRQMKQFLDESTKRGATIKSGWTKVYQELGYCYARTTAGRYRLWMKEIDEDKLTAYIGKYGDKPVRHGIKYFHTEWVETDTRVTKSEPSSAKRVKL